MLAIAVSLLFGLAAFTALSVIGSSLRTAWRRAPALLAELAAIDAQPRARSWTHKRGSTVEWRRAARRRGSSWQAWRSGLRYRGSA